MWHSHISKLRITSPFDVLVASDTCQRSSTNLTVDNVLARQGSSLCNRALISMCRSSRVKVFISIAKHDDRCFCFITATTFVPFWREQTWRLYTKLYKLGWHAANGEQMIFCKVGYIVIIYHIPDSWIYWLNDYDF